MLYLHGCPASSAPPFVRGSISAVIVYMSKGKVEMHFFVVVALYKPTRP